MIWKAGADLEPGDVLLMGDQGAHNVRTTVLRTGVLAPPDRFGRVFDAVLVRREDTGAEGVVTYGPGGTFPLAEGGSS